MADIPLDPPPASEELKQRVESRRELFEDALRRLDPHSDEAHRLEGKLRDLEQILKEDWENASTEVVAELERWLAEDYG